MQEELSVNELMELKEEPVLPLAIRIELQRHSNEGDSCIRKFTTHCHFYYIGTDGALDLFLIEFGRLRKFASFNQALSVVEVTNG